MSRAFSIMAVPALGGSLIHSTIFIGRVSFYMTFLLHVGTLSAMRGIFGLGSASYSW